MKLDVGKTQNGAQILFFVAGNAEHTSEIVIWFSTSRLSKQRKIFQSRIVSFHRNWAPLRSLLETLFPMYIWPSPLLLPLPLRGIIRKRVAWLNVENVTFWLYYCCVLFRSEAQVMLHVGSVLRTPRHVIGQVRQRGLFVPVLLVTYANWDRYATAIG